MMNRLQNKNSEIIAITENWGEHSKLLKEKFSNLTDNDLKFERGKENELLSKLGFRLNKRRQEVIDIIKKIQS